MKAQRNKLIWCAVVALTALLFWLTWPVADAPVHESAPGYSVPGMSPDADRILEKEVSAPHHITAVAPRAETQIAPPPVPPEEPEEAFVAGPHSGGVILHIENASTVDDMNAPIEIYAVGSPYLADYPSPVFGQLDTRPRPRTITAHGPAQMIFVPWLGKQTISCVASSAERTDIFENIECAKPLLPPTTATLRFSTDAYSGIVVGTARYQDGRPAGGYRVRVNPAGSNTGARPVWVMQAADIVTCRGREAITAEDGSFIVTGLPLGKDAIVALAIRGQAVVGAANVEIVPEGSAAPRIELVVPDWGRRFIDLRYGGEPIPGAPLLFLATNEAAVTSGVRCDATGRADLLYSPACHAYLLAFSFPPIEGFVASRVGLINAGFGPTLQDKLLSCIVTPIGMIRRRLDFTQQRSEDIIVVDLKEDFATYVDDPQWMERLREVARTCSGKGANTSAELKSVAEGGSVEPLLAAFLKNLWVTQSGRDR